MLKRFGRKLNSKIVMKEVLKPFLDLLFAVEAFKDQRNSSVLEWRMSFDRHWRPLRNGELSICQV